MVLLSVLIQMGSVLSDHWKKCMESNVKVSKVLLIGAGGAARGIAFALEHMGYGPIVITNRTVDKAQQLAATVMVPQHIT